MHDFNTYHKLELRVILLAEDDEDDVFLFKEALDKHNDFEIKVAANGLEALTVLNDLPEADIIFLDINMPRMDGVECLIKIRNLQLGIPVVILTTSSNPKLIEQTKILGASGFICKPKDFNTFQKVMKDVLSIDWKKDNSLFYLSIE